MENTYEYCVVPHYMTEGCDHREYETRGDRLIFHSVQKALDKIKELRKAGGYTRFELCVRCITPWKITDRFAGE